MEINKGNTEVKVNLLGDFNIEVGDKEYGSDLWYSKKALTIFKYLITRPNKKVQKYKLIEVLWPSSEKEQDHNLHTNIYFLRKTLKSILNVDNKVIKFTKGHYMIITPDNLRIDSEEFETAVSKGQKLENSEPEQALGLFRKAIYLYKGDFLVNDLYLDWTNSLRKYYKEVYIQLILKASSLIVKLEGNYKQAAQLCHKGLKVDPYSNELYYNRILYLMEDRSYIKALQIYEEYRTLIFEEFGLNPGPEMEELLENINKRIEDRSKFLNLLENSGFESGAYCCSRNIFRSIYELEVRRQKRNNQSFTLIIVQIPKKDSEASQSDISAIKNRLRQGDAICLWSDDKILILLHNSDQEIARHVQYRLENTLGYTKVNYKVIHPSHKPYLLAQVI